MWNDIVWFVTLVLCVALPVWAMLYLGDDDAEG